MFRFHRGYFLLTTALFVIEVCIALFVHDRIVRPYVGDVLVVGLMYCFLRSFLAIRPLPLVVGVLIFSFVIETLQYFHYVRVLALDDSAVASTVMGTSFEWIDLVAYTAGAVIVFWLETWRSGR